MREGNERFARKYLQLTPRMDAAGAAEHRAELLAGLSGRVCEIGAGGGANFARYPAAVTHVLAVEPEPLLREAAEQEAQRVRSAGGPDVQVVAGAGEHVDAAAGSFDAVVACLVLCSVDEQAPVLAEAHRLLRPGGRLAVYEHVRSDLPGVGWLEDLVAPVWSRFAGGCHPNRDTLAAVAAAGFRIDEQRRFGWSPSALVPPTAHVIAQATRP